MLYCVVMNLDDTIAQAESLVDAIRTTTAILSTSESELDRLFYRLEKLETGVRGCRSNVERAWGACLAEGDDHAL